MQHFSFYLKLNWFSDLNFKLVQWACPFFCCSLNQPSMCLNFCNIDTGAKIAFLIAITTTEKSSQNKLVHDVGVLFFSYELSSNLSSF